MILNIIEDVEKKLSEARFFLEKMIDHERMASRDFDFYLSAFLNAGRTVDYRLRREQKAIYPTWRTAWDAALAQEQQDLIKFMVDERNVEVHRGGSSRVVKTENREVGPGTHSLATGTHEVSAPPDVFPAAIIRTHAYYFTIDGIDRKATEACGEYLRLLEQMVAAFKADHPQS
jgi:hypothetical protein